MQVQLTNRNAVNISERDYALLEALSLISCGRVKNAAVGDLRFTAQLICRAEARDQGLPASLEALNLDISDVGPMLALAKRLEDA